MRVRMIDRNAYITVKGISYGMTRSEYEYEIPLSDAEEILINICEKPLIEKRRYKIPGDGVVWEIDEFLNENQGLIIAEVELGNERQEFKRPSWLGEEVTGDPKYFNSSLIKHPYSTW